MGLYNDRFFQLSDECLNPQEVGQDLHFMYEFINGRESPFQVLKFVTTTKTLVMQQSINCGYVQALYDLQEWCNDHDELEEKKA